MNEHVVDYQDSGHPAGMVALLGLHDRHVDWTTDGRTCEPGQRCAAISATSNELCGKREAVVELEARTKYARVDRPTHVIPLCGGHFNSHRAGHGLRVVVTPARAG
jgi:hypothetical protein